VIRLRCARPVYFRCTLPSKTEEQREWAHTAGGSCWVLAGWRHLRGQLEPVTRSIIAKKLFQLASRYFKAVPRPCSGTTARRCPHAVTAR
jgi:hypothetical protein